MGYLRRIFLNTSSIVSHIALIIFSSVFSPMIGIFIFSFNALTRASSVLGLNKYCIIRSFNFIDIYFLFFVVYVFMVYFTVGRARVVFWVIFYIIAKLADRYNY